jgi:Fe-S oxidoreductase
MLRCVGVGQCRRGESGTMCPSYMVTREEKHSTRGRARMLFEMLQGEVIHDGWHSKEVLESLDLCLACKGCQSDCPMHVDMATYKAEFLSHYYERRLRPRHAYSMGLIHLWARIASKMPRLVNFVAEAPIIGPLIKWIGGISQKRTMPKFATETFRAWWAKREQRAESGHPVVLWVDTFNDHFHPEILQAAVEVLEATGHRIILPQEKLCCGRPLYDFGMLDYAKKLLAEILVSLRKEIHAEIPIVGLEPSCVSVFRDELKRLFPFDEDATRLAQRVVTFSEYFIKYSDFVFPKLNRYALVHGHCHDKAVMKMDGSTEFLKHLGLQFQVLDSGCCGMAGSFGFEKEHYEVSVRCGERVLLPSVRQADSETLLIADGFSCREQIEQLAQRRALHTAEVAAKALREGSLQNAEGRKIEPPHTIPEMQEQSELKNRTRAEPMEIGHEH